MKQTSFGLLLAVCWLMEKNLPTTGMHPCPDFGYALIHFSTSVDTGNVLNAS